MQKEKINVLVKWCLALLIVAGVFACCKQTSYAIMCGSCPPARTTLRL
ncbi:MAG: hypothetical protein J5626_10745 [Lachnospiraceae bacterium]|nr:hypothetical protein [Lachnospiraceae bacterium]